MSVGPSDFFHHSCGLLGATKAIVQPFSSPVLKRAPSKKHVNDARLITNMALSFFTMNGDAGYDSGEAPVPVEIDGCVGQYGPKWSYAAYAVPRAAIRAPASHRTNTT